MDGPYVCIKVEATKYAVHYKDASHLSTLQPLETRMDS